MSISVVRRQGLTGQVNVEYMTSPSTALVSQDYMEQSGSLVFSSGQQTQTISIRILEVSISVYQ